MNFLYPAGLAFFALIPVVIALFLLKVRHRTASVSTIMLWRQVLGQHRRRTLFQKLRQWLSLLLHLLILALIVFALARPQPGAGPLANASAVVLVLDDRVAMQALESGEKSRFDRAKSVALAAVESAGNTREFAVLTTAGGGRVVSPFSGEPEELRTRITALTNTDAGGTMEGALSLAQELAASRGKEGAVWVIGAGLSPEGDLTWTNVAQSSPANVAITQFAARPLPNSPTTAAVLVEVANFSDSSRDGNVALTLENRPLESRPFSLEPGARTTLVFPALDTRRQFANARSWLRAKLDTTDALPADDVAFAILPENRPVRVLLAATDNLFLERALQQDPGVQLEVMENVTPDLARGFDVVVFDRKLPETWPWLENTMPPTLLLAAAPGQFLKSPDPIPLPMVSASHASHPVGWLIDLRDVQAPSTLALSPPENSDWIWTRVVESDGTPMILAGAAAGETTRMVVTGFDALQTDLPLRVGFPLLISNSVRWLAGRDLIENVAAPRAGESFPLPPGTELAIVPEKEFRPVPTREAADWRTGGFLPLKAGFYELRENGNTRWLGVSVADATSSDLRGSAAGPAVGAASPKLASSSWTAWLRQPFWVWLALAALVLFSLEWWWFHRRITE